MTRRLPDIPLSYNAAQFRTILRDIEANLDRVARSALQRAEASGDAISMLRTFTNPTDVLPFDGANFIDNGDSWTVGEADQDSFWYSIVGKMMTVSLFLRDVTTDGSTNVYFVKIPAGKAGTRRTLVPLLAYDGSVWSSGHYLDVNPAVDGGTRLSLANGQGVNWPALSGAAYFMGQITFPIA